MLWVKRRFPDLSYVTAHGSLDAQIDVVLVSHFHLDHCGALPYMTEMVGYSGPVLMTLPTKAVCPLLLEDYRKIAVERKGTLTARRSADTLTATTLYSTTLLSKDY